ncbi:hypothetical protein BKA69DRAFT_497249 [Paraphysoderma sedebokerense]|nr:hypothetical protein BKA69DRAFT_497249 [Paraphysoderma sedebokerense]
MSSEDKEQKPTSKLPWGLNSAKPAKGLTKQKLEKFTLGVQKKSAFQRQKELEEERKRKEEEEAAKVYAEFVASFEDEDKLSKSMFVRGGTIQAKGVSLDVNPEESSSQYYQPKAKYSEVKPPNQYTNSNTSSVHSRLGNSAEEKKDQVAGKKRKMEKFLETLKRQEEGKKTPSIGALKAGMTEMFHSTPQPGMGSFDTGDPSTTNLYVGNLNPNTSEELLCQYFGQYGDIASIKIMWPRTQEERDRGRNCGFVSYMKREDAEIAVKEMDGTEILGYVTRVGWGKAVPLPASPVYVKKPLPDSALASSKLPFNAQPLPPKPIELTIQPAPAETLKPTVRVTIPSDPGIRDLIHRVVERVVRYGPPFEALIMDKEWENPSFSWMFVNTDPYHIYYRWKLYSILNGDDLLNWRVEPFEMFDDDIVWIPPSVPFDWMSAEAINVPPTDSDLEAEREHVTKGTLPAKSRSRFEVLLRQLRVDRNQIARCMMLAIDHADSATEIVHILTRALVQPDTPMQTKIARLYLLSDILHNCGASVPNAWKYRVVIEGKLQQIFQHLNEVYCKISARLKADYMKRCVMSTVQAWSMWMVFPEPFLEGLKETFLQSRPIETEGKDSIAEGMDDDNDNGENVKKKKKIGVKTKWDE